MIDPKTLAMMQAASNVRSSLRSGKTGQSLLDDGENNVGNATSLSPQILPPDTSSRSRPKTLPRAYSTSRPTRRRAKVSLSS